MNNPGENGSAGLTPRVVVYFRNLDLHQNLISELVRDYVVTITSQLTELNSILGESRNEIVLMEIPVNEDQFYDVLKKILKKRPDTKIVISDGDAKRATIAEAFRMGVCDYFPEPVNQDLLVERLRTLTR